MQYSNAKKNHKEHRITMHKMIQFFALLSIFFYPFNYHLSENMFFGKLNPYIFSTIGILLLLISGLRKISKKSIFHISLALLLLVGLILHNAYIKYNFSLGTFSLIALYILIFIALLICKVDNKTLLVVLSIYSMEHIIGTIIPIVAPSLYLHSILPYICRGQNYCFAAHQFAAGQNPGLTGHYSTNGIYATISTLLYSATYFKTKDKRALILSIITIGLLLVIGKRAHLVYSILSIILSYIIINISTIKSSFRKNISKIFKLSVVLCISLIIFIFAAHRIPQLNTTINRIIAKGIDEESLTGRDELWDLAITEWKSHPIFGNGFGYYLYESGNHFSSERFHVGNIRAHNDYLEILCDVGIIGLISYSIILIKNLFICIKNAKKTNSGPIHIFYLEYIIFYIVYGLTGAPLSSVPTLLLIIFAISLNAERIEKDKR